MTCFEFEVLGCHYPIDKPILLYHVHNNFTHTKLLQSGSMKNYWGVEIICMANNY